MDHLRLEDMSDREVLLVMLDLGGGDAVAPADIAEHIGIRGEHPRRAVSSRMAWLKRWGAVDKEFETDEHGNVLRRRSGEPRTTQRYRPTQLGRDVATGALRAAQSKTLDGLTDAQMLEVTRWLTERTDGNLNTLVRREWRYRTEYAKRTNGRRAR